MRPGQPAGTGAGLVLRAGGPADRGRGLGERRDRVRRAGGAQCRPAARRRRSSPAGDPCAALLGALLVVWADTAARTVLAPTEVPIGILTAVVGVPAFVLAIRRQVVDPR
ncbi:iron chelate uptake ABC transporter family permease subunit [Enemella evansiae]